MDIVLIAKALSNETRLHILTWLKEPEKYFPPQKMYIPENHGTTCPLMNLNPRRIIMKNKWFRKKEKECKSKYLTWIRKYDIFYID